jgi:hypothetical protein
MFLILEPASFIMQPFFRFTMFSEQVFFDPMNQLFSNGVCIIHSTPGRRAKPDRSKQEVLTGRTFGGL